ncbi:MAG: hypothetical protein R3B93_01520 [Bacteroidia bacterium]
MICLEKRISDVRVLKLIRKWLKAPVASRMGLTVGQKAEGRNASGRDISPLLSGIYLHLLDKIVGQISGVFSQSGVKMIPVCR